MSISRRGFLAGSAGISALGLIAACTSNDNSTPAQPQRGGTLRVGALGKASSVERDPHQSLNNNSDFLITSLIFDALTVPGENPNTAPRLAAQWEQLGDPRQWRFTLAPGATFHDGSPVTADDVVWSLRRLREIAGETKVPVSSPGDIVADGPAAVIITTPAPNRDLPMLLRLMTFTVKRDSTDFSRPVGTGPFRLDTFDNGNARLVRNPDWYGEPPTLDAIEVVRFESATAMANAVLANQIDLASNVGAVAGRAAEGRSGFTVIRRPNDVVIPIAMRTADGPFSDPRVRAAMRLVVDRDAMVKQALSGYGSVANDVLGTGDPTIDKSLPQRSRDLDQARALLAEANFDLTKTYRLITKDEAVGEVDSARLFAGQAQAAGIKIEVVTQDSNVFYDDTWLSAPLYTANWGTNDSVIFFASKTMYSGTKWNETGFDDSEFDSVYGRALAARDDDAYEAASRDLQRIQYDRGGYIVWGMADGVDIAGSHVEGLPTLGGFGRVQLERAWLAR
ncbi:ABC transporter substrate-binding protein [Nocardia farcinica]|nr:ABC transporter substrate-binding protein [Nocardia farcinica]